MGLTCREEDNDDDDGYWDVNVFWEIDCPETFGRFDFGGYKGVFCCTTLQLDHEFLFNFSDKIQAETSLRFFPWKGKSMGEEVIKLKSDS